MTLERDLAPDLDRALAHLPSVPATSYLTAARKVRRRRRIASGSLAVAVLVGGGLVLESALDEPAAPTLVATPGSDDPGPETPVTGPGLDGVDAFTTQGIPEWAQEYGNNGPIAIAPDGRLWIAPGAVVQRSVANPIDGEGTEDVPASYAVEARYEGETNWVLFPGTMEPPGLWTNDFDLWVDNQASQFENRPSVAERLVHFAGPDSERLASGDGVELVRQLNDVALPPSTFEQHPRSSVAEVRWGGRPGSCWPRVPLTKRRSSRPTRRRSSAPPTSKASWPGSSPAHERPRRVVHRVRHGSPGPAPPDRVRRVPGRQPGRGRAAGGLRQALPVLAEGPQAGRGGGLHPADHRQRRHRRPPQAVAAASGGGVRRAALPAPGHRPAAGRGPLRAPRGAPRAAGHAAAHRGAAPPGGTDGGGDGRRARDRRGHREEPHVPGAGRAAGERASRRAALG